MASAFGRLSRGQGAPPKLVRHDRLGVQNAIAELELNVEPVGTCSVAVGVMGPASDLHLPLDSLRTETYHHPAMERYLRPTEVIDCDTESIRNRARLIAEGLETDRERAVELFYFVRDEVRTNPFAPGDDLLHYKASATLERGHGQCQQKAVLLVALARAMGIPARLGFTDIRDHLLSDKLREVMGGTNLLSYHGHAELCIDGKWFHASPAYDAEMCRQKHFVPVDFDGAKDAKDPPYDQDGRPHIEYVKVHGHYDDFPWDEILRAVLKTYG